MLAPNNLKLELDSLDALRAVGILSAMVEAPPEIWLYIAQFLPPSDLRKMISVNRTFFELVMDWRYRQAAFIHLNPFEFVKAMKRLEWVLFYIVAL